MPRFNIPDRQVGVAQGQASPQAFGAGVGQAIAGVGQAVGDVAKVIQKKKDDDENTQIAMDSTDLAHDLEVSLDQFKKDYPDGNDLAAKYEEHLDKQISDYVSTVSPKKQDKVKSHFAREKSRLAMKAIGAQATLGAASKRARLDNQVDNSIALIERGSDYTEQQELLMNTVKTLPAHLQADVGGEIRDRILEAELRRSLDQDGYRQTKERMESGEFDDMKAGARTKWFNLAKGKVKSDISDTIRSASAAIQSGQVAPDLSGAISTARDMGLDDEVETLTMLQSANQYSYDFARSGFSIQNEEASRLRDKGFNEPLTDTERLKLKVAEDHIRYRQRMIDGGRAYEYYESLELIPDVSPLPIASNDPDEWSEAISDREASRTSIMLRDGVDPGVLTPNEVGALQSMLEETTPGNYADRLSVLSKNFGKERISKVTQEINRKDKRLAGDMAIASSDPQLLARIKAGRGMPVDIPKEKDIKAKMTELGYTTSGLSKTVLDNLYENGSDFMKWRVSQGHPIDNDFIESTLTQLLPKPGVMSNGTFSLSPKKEDGSYIDHNSFSKAFKNLTDDDLSALEIPSPAFGNTVMSIEDVIPHARVIPLDNETEFYLVKESTGEPFRDSSGGVISFNAEKLVQQVESRRASARTTRYKRRQMREQEQ